MMTEKHLRDIELGPRQIYLFDIENDASADQDRFMAWIVNHIEMHGQPELDEVVQTASGALNWPEFKILQHLFWLAHDLKIHFRINEENISPAAAKKLLVESSQPNLKIVLNQPVDETVLRCVRDFFKHLPGSLYSDEYYNQIELAHCLAGQIRNWKSALQSYRNSALRPGFPGRREIEAGLDLLKHVSAKLDSFSLIHACFHHIDEIALLAQTIRILSDFYAEHADRWHMMVQFAEETSKTLAVYCKDPDMASAYQRFNRILTSAQPFEQVEEAWRLHEALKPLHGRIVAQQTQQCRQTVLSEIESLIQKMKDHLQAHAASADLRNQSLYPLQMNIKKTKAAKTIAAINHGLHSARESFEASWDKIVAEGQNL